MGISTAIYLNIAECTTLDMAKFTARLVRWGNSVGINIPKPIRDSLDLDVGDEVEIVDNQDTITIRKLQNVRK